MKKTKESLLKVALRLFNKQGVANISIRQIAAEAGISHSNLIYHYPTKNDLINALHDQMLEAAIRLNEQVQAAQNPIAGMKTGTVVGFKVVYEFRFLLADLNHILRENKPLHKTILKVEKLRATMYHLEIQKAVESKFMRKELYEGEYAELVERIRIFSDFWISSAEIYDSGPADAIIQKHVKLFMGFIYPYLTEKGRKEFEAMA